MIPPCFYIHTFPGSLWPPTISREKKSGKAAAINFISQPLFIAFFNFSHKRSTFAFALESGYTLGFRRKIAHKGLHAETGAFRMGALPKNAESLGTAMRSCVSLFRGVAAPLGRVIFFAFVEIAACTPCAQSFSRVQGGERYHYPRRALHVLETLDGRLSKRLVCRFLRSMGIAPRATPIFLRIYRYSCR